MDKLIITVALTGNVPTKDMNPHLPVSPEEIAADVRRCAAAGAVLFHVHARDADQRPTLAIELFKPIVAAVKRAAPQVIIQLTTGGRAGMDPQARMAPIRLEPEMGSFTTGSTNLPGMVYANPPDLLLAMAQAYQETGVKPEIEVFEAGMIQNALFLQHKGLLHPPLHFDFVLGAPGAMAASVRNLTFLVDSLPPGATWSVAGIGRAELPMAAAAIAMGGHVRVGLEDNLLLPDGQPASNPALVQRVVAIADAVGRPVATPDEARHILSIPSEARNRILKHLDP